MTREIMNHLKCSVPFSFQNQEKVAGELLEGLLARRLKGHLTTEELQGGSADFGVVISTPQYPKWLTSRGQALSSQTKHHDKSVDSSFHFFVILNK